MTREEAIYQLMSLMPSKKKIVCSWTKEHAEALSMAIRALESNPWHKVSKELPKETCEVLICWETVNHKKKWMTPAMFYVHADTGCGRFEDIDGWIKEPDYWMPIPEIKED